MPKSIKLLFFVWACGLLNFTAVRCFARVEPIQNTIYGPFANNVTLTTVDDKFEQPAFNWANINNKSVQNTISLRVNDNVLITYTFTYTVTIKVDYYTSPYQTAPPTSNTIALTVTYNPGQGAVFKGLDTYSFQGGYRVICTVTGTSGLPPGANMVTLTNRIEIDRSYNFLATDNVGATYTQSGNQLQVSLTDAMSADEYDLEWTTINDGNPNFSYISSNYPAGNATPGNAALYTALAQSFRNNSSRVTLVGSSSSAISYTLQMVTTDNLLLVRMRKVQYNAAGIRVTGNWDYKSGSNYAVWMPAWNEPNLNWQYSAAYAEEGKKKEVISYFDGTLRGRQTLTINNFDKTLVAQENIYDEFGRVTASFLPAPFKPAVANNPVLAYVNNFNVISANQPYSFLNVIGAAGNACELKPDAASTLGGAYKYYSPANDFTTNKDYIPDAEGYPLSVTQYTSDNTGRIKIQGGVGKAFQPGLANGHVTRYFYGKPEQWELDQLFGNDVGYAVHYLKNMVVDPNGQVSISYLNASGKTIATALSGPKPPNMDTIASYSTSAGTKTRRTHILEPEKFIYKSTDLKLTASTTYLATVTGNDSLIFSIQKLVTKYPGAFKLCSNCSYKMTATITDDCSTPMGSRSKIVGSVTANPADSDMYRDTIPMAVSRIGEYNITIEFAFDNAVIENYTDTYINTGIDSGYIEKQFGYIKKRFLDSLDVSGCYADCHTCNMLLGTQADFVQMMKDKFLALEIDPVSVNDPSFASWAGALHTRLKFKCDSLQTNCKYDPCSSTQALMELDINPGGQYSLFKDDGVTPLEPEINILVGTGTTPNWRLQFPVLDPSDARYQAELITLDSATTTSPYDASFTQANLITYWKPEWATKFLIYHPEYCKLQFCMTKTAPYKSWDLFLEEQVKTVGDISRIPGPPPGYVTSRTSNNIDWLLNTDPFFKADTGLGKAYYGQMHADLLNYSTNILKNNNSSLVVKNIFQYIDFSLYCQDVSGSTFTNTNVGQYDSWNNCTPAAGCRVPDREWSMYRDIYLDMKSKYYDALATAQCGSTCPVGQKLSIQLPGSCAVAADFSIKPNVVSQTACPGSQSVLLTRDAGSVSQTTTVTLYYPPVFNSLSPTTTFTFLSGESQKAFCVPIGIPLKSILVQSVSCGSGGGSGGGGGGVSTAGWVVNVVDEVDNSSTLNHCAATQYQPKHLLATLLDANGQPVQAPFKVTVNFVLNEAQSAGGASTPVDDYVSINIGQTSAEREYMGSINTSQCYFGYQYAYVSCIKSVVGVPLKANIALQPCAGYTYTAGTPPPSNCPAVYANKVSRFPDVDDSFATAIAGKAPATVASDGVAAIKAQAKDMCTNNAETWINRLRAGIADTTRIPALRQALIDICAAGGDTAHPFGASSTPAATPAGDYNFGDAIKRTILLSPTAKFTANLNPWLIDAPYPFAPVQQSVQKTISNSNADICNLLNTLITRAGSTPLYNYMVATYQSAMTLTSAEVTVLQNSCSSCKYLLSQDILLPVFLDPGNPGVITGAQYVSAKSNMDSQFAVLDTADFNYQDILSNFMNQRFGFSLTYDDYAKFAPIAAANSTAILCNTLPYGPAKLDPYECVKSMMTVAVYSGKVSYDNYIAAQRRSFRNNYINTCKAAQANATLIAKEQNYHYTLYYYDQADNLVRTVPPEGVTLLDTALFKGIDAARDQDTTGTAYAYNGPGAANTSGAFTTLSAVLSAPLGAVEMWLYSNGTTTNHFVEATTDRNYLFQVGVAGNKLNIDVYPMLQSVASSIDFTAPSGHYQADISGKLPLAPFTHIVFQGASLGSGTTVPELYLNGTKLTLLNPPVTPAAFGFTVQATSTAVTFPDSTHALKHLLLYKHKLTPAQIAADAANTHFYASDVTYEGWYRFNVPAAGGLTTVGPGSTDETSLFYRYNDHRLPTTYAYNSTNQVLLQNSPDGGTNRYWYDLLSRLNFSQNDKQLVIPGSPAKYYSYNSYDQLGRIAEVGQKRDSSLNLGQPGYLTDAVIAQFKAAGKNGQITNSYYDAPAPAGISGIANPGGQNNLRKRVSASTYTETQGGPVLNATYYNYDLDGNVNTLWQQISGLHVGGANDLKRIDYEYDLVSGKVNFVRYQDGKPDQFYYNYKYDAENRVIEAYTGTKAIVNAAQGSYLQIDKSKLEASYEYYLHGPLRRVELGDKLSKLQGIDYAYTLQGWLKGVNSTAVTGAADMGGDAGTLHPSLPKDAYGYNLYYYNTDFKNITAGKVAFATTMQTTPGFLRELFNGNIAASSVNIPQLQASWLDRKYAYDQLNRLTHVTTYHTAGMSSAPAYSGDYEEQFDYDGNGNILNVNRSGAGTGTQKDIVGYSYNRGSDNRLLNNRLNYLNGTAAASGITPNQAVNNYTYDAIGNLTADVQAGISNINWTVYGKIRSITNTNPLSYQYDAGGNRVSKTRGTLSTWYVRDAQGNTLGVYDNKGGTVNWREQHLYGSSRLGVWAPNVNVAGNTSLAAWDTIGRRQYELTNHLGNVLATITDKRLPHSTNGTAIDYYMPDISTAQDYYAFGSLQPGNTYSFTAGKNYRYGFNGKENDNDVAKGTGNQQDYGMRIYDPRVGRFLSVDPLTRKYAFLSPYQFSSNSPIMAIDEDGGEMKYYNIDYVNRNGKTSLSLTSQIRTDDVAFGVGIQTSLHGVVLTETKLTDFNYSAIGMTAFVVGYQGQWRVLPSSIDPNSLPDLNDPIWKTFESPNEYKQRIYSNIKTLVDGVGLIKDLKDIYKALKSKNAIDKINANDANSFWADKYSKNRPTFRKGTVEEVWERAKDASGKVFDPNTLEELSWDKFKSRYDQWHMGHKPEQEFSKLVEKLRNGEISKKEFLNEFNNPDHYRPESPAANMSHKYEAPPKRKK